MRSRFGFRRSRLRRRRALEPADAKYRHFEKHARRDQQISRAQRHRQHDRDDRAEQGAGRAAGANEAEQPLALLGVEQVGHERPEDGDREQIEHADPDKKYARDDRGLDAERQQQPEQRQIGDKEMIDDGNEARARQFRHQRTVERLRDQQGDEGGGKQPRQVLDAAGDAHLVAQRPQHVIAGEQREEIGERPQRRRAFLRRRRHRPAQSNAGGRSWRQVQFLLELGGAHRLAVSGIAALKPARIRQLADHHRVEARIAHQSGSRP